MKYVIQTLMEHILNHWDILKLQCVQNCVASVVRRSPRFCHSVPLMKSHHGLPVQSRIIFKLCTIIYQTLSSGESSYLFSMLSLSPEPRELRSSGFHLFSFPRVKTHVGTRAFSVAVTTLWNSLPEHVKSSNNIVSSGHHLKTHLFGLAKISLQVMICMLPGPWVCSTPRCATELDFFEDIGAIEVL